jgi:hypothetical protein
MPYAHRDDVCHVAAVTTGTPAPGLLPVGEELAHRRHRVVDHLFGDVGVDQPIAGIKQGRSRYVVTCRWRCGARSPIRPLRRGSPSRLTLGTACALDLPAATHQWPGADQGRSLRQVWTARACPPLTQMPMSGSCRSKYLCTDLYAFTGGQDSQFSLAVRVESALTPTRRGVRVGSTV